MSFLQGSDSHTFIGRTRAASQEPGLGAGVRQGRGRTVGPLRPAPARPIRPAPPRRPSAPPLLPSWPFRLTQQCSRAGRARTMERTAAGKELALVRGPGVPGPYIPGNPRVQKLQAPNCPLGLSPQIRLLGTAWGVPTSGLWAPDPVKWLVPFRGESLKASMGEIIDRLRATGHQSATPSFQRPERRVPAAPRDFPEPGQGREDETRAQA